MSMIGPEQPHPANSFQVGMKVQIIGERGFFLITYIDQRRHTVDLIPLSGGQTIRGIHISAITIPSEHQAANSLFGRLTRRENEAA